jgi:hypothetical protein
VGCSADDLLPGKADKELTTLDQAPWHQLPSTEIGGENANHSPIAAVDGILLCPSIELHVASSCPFEAALGGAVNILLTHDETALHREEWRPWR